MYISRCYSEHDRSQLLQGVVICMIGLGLLVASDQITHKNWTALDKGRGDVFMIIGATLYGFSASCTVTLTRELTETSKRTQLRSFSCVDHRYMRSWASLACGE